jgi:putative endonuclease
MSFFEKTMGCLTMKSLAPSTWEVYIIETQSGKLYTGITNNFERRFQEHQKRQRGARFFHFSAPKKVVFRKSYPNRSEASKEESSIKKMSRGEKVALITSTTKKKKRGANG